MYNFCTLFDSRYLTRGLALYESLMRVTKDFHLYIFAFDEEAYRILTSLNLTKTTVVSLEEFEDETLKEVKKTRTSKEYCWTCTPSVIRYCLHTFSLQSCIYLDADLYFFHDPAILLAEMPREKSVMITEHRYTPQYDQTASSGIFCVQFMVFKNTPGGNQVLEWWRNACNAWCYDRQENGKFGDQKYLDDWPQRFAEEVYVLQHLGGGVAPWNIQQYKLEENANGGIKGVSSLHMHSFEVVFYHFHNVMFLENNRVDLGHYRLSKRDLELLYKPYLMHLYTIDLKLKRFNAKIDYTGKIKEEVSVRRFLKTMKRRLTGEYNKFDMHKLIGV